MATNYELWTFRDTIEHVLDGIHGNNKSPRNYRSARRAVTEAMREFVNSRSWRYFQRRLRIATVADQITGTVEYTNSSRTMTLSDATWPADVLNYSLLIGQARYEIESRSSDTVIVLSAEMNPGGDLAAGTSYKLFRDTYQLPDNFVTMGALQDVLDPERIVAEATVHELNENHRLYRSGLPTNYTVGKHPRYAGGLAIIFAPAPNTARVYECVYTARQAPLTVEYYTTGTVTSTADSTSVTGSGTAFTSLHAGAVIRFSRDAVNLPTSLIGNYDDVENPFAMQRIIKSVTNGTTLVLEQAADQSLAGVKFTISSPIDLEHGAMLNAFLRLCEAKFCRSMGRDDARAKQVDATREWGIAAETDQRRKIPDESYMVPMRISDLANSVNNEP